MRVNCCTDIGAVRSSNQDAFATGSFSQNSVWAVVCDGMGGANGGNVASKLAVEKIEAFLTAQFSENMSKSNIKNLLINSLREANREVFDRAHEDCTLTGMGTTAVVMLATKGVLHVAHVGDSRAYLYMDGKISQITMDHSYVQDLVNSGQITQEEARVHPQRNIITRVLGVHEEVQCDYDLLDFPSGSLALGCTDGLSNYAPEEVLLDYVEKYGLHGKTLAKELIRFAVDSGGSDNITVSVLYNDN